MCAEFFLELQYPVMECSEVMFGGDSRKWAVRRRRQTLRQRQSPVCVECLVLRLDRVLFHVEDDAIDIHMEAMEPIEHGHDAAFVMRPTPHDRLCGVAARTEGNKHSDETSDDQQSFEHEILPTLLAERVLQSYEFLQPDDDGPEHWRNSGST